MKIRSLILDAGSIILWKQYNPLIKLWNKILRRDLPFNRFTLVSQRTEFLTIDNLKDIVVYEPIRKYNKQEITKLSVITSDNNYYKDWKETVTLVNIVRPNTLQSTDTIDKCRYYKKVECNEKLDEYIY